MAKNGASLSWGGLDKAVSKACHKLGDTKDLMESVGEALVSGTSQRFEDEEDPQGQKWPKSGRASKQGGQTLTDTGRLSKSIDYAATSNKVMVGSNLAYARIHQKGGVITPKKAKRLIFKGSDGQTVSADKVTIPARPYLGVSDEDMEEVKAVMADFLAGAFKA